MKSRLDTAKRAAVHAGRTVLRFMSLQRPETAAAFAGMCALHLLLKIFLGLYLVVGADYGFSWVAPPRSLLFVASDVVIVYALSLLAERALPRRVLPGFLGVLVAACLVFLVCNYAAYSYFKSFVTYGLIQFNGASWEELVDYFRASLDALFAGFLACAVAVTAWSFVALYRRRKWESKLTRIGRWALLSAVASGLLWDRLSVLGNEETGRLVHDPLVDLVHSAAIAFSIERAAPSPEEVAKFVPPEKLLFGVSATELPDGFSLPAPRKQNVLVVLIESLPACETPLLDPASPLAVVDTLMRDGIAFDSYRTVFPATSRSFIAMHCGTYPDTGFDTISRYMTDFACVSLPAELARNGYRTGLFHASMMTYDNLDATQLVREYGVVEDYFSFKKQSKASRFTARAVEEEVVAERVLDFMKSGEKPFFATWFLYWTHLPYQVPGVPDPGVEVPKQDRYRKSLAYVNGAIEALLEEMRTAGLLEDTLVILTADHGESLGRYRNTQAHSNYLYEDAIRIPLVMRVPGMSRGFRIARSGTNVDFAPTLFGLLGLTAPTHWQGQDLLSAGYAPKPALLFARAARLANGILDGNWKYIYYLDDERAEHFYDLASDPFEQNDLVKSKGAETRRYREIVETWLEYQQARISSRR